MKTDLLFTGMIAILLALPALSRAAETDWASQSPLTFGEPMDDCGPHHPELIVQEASPAVIIPAAVTPAAMTPAVLPATPKVPAGSNARLAPGPAGSGSPMTLTPAALLSFALIASPGTALPQSGNAASGR